MRYSTKGVVETLYSRSLVGFLLAGYLHPRWIFQSYVWTTAWCSPQPISLITAVVAVCAFASSSTTTTCLSDTDANTVADHFGELLSDYSNASADAYLTADFTDYSDSVIGLIKSGCPNFPIPVRISKLQGNSDRADLERAAWIRDLRLA